MRCRRYSLLMDRTRAAWGQVSGGESAQALGLQLAPALGLALASLLGLALALPSVTALARA